MKKTIICPECEGRMEFVPYVTNGQRHGLKAVHVQCDRCNGTGEVEVPMTNFDAIKRMSVEEMAEFIRDNFVDCPSCVAYIECGHFESCRLALIHYLNSEYKGEKE